jgi:regulation of enolase protein 1 (concanavalin A-like superfamily)
VERSTDNTTFNPLITLPANTTRHSDTTVSGGATYYYRVRALSGGPASGYSNTASVITPGAPPTGPGWQSRDIGEVGAAGATSESDGAVTMHASGADIWNAADEFQFYYQPVAGDATITVRVTGLGNTHGWAKAGVMFRESLSATSRHAMMIVSIAHGTAFQFRSAMAGDSISSTPTEIGSLPRYLRLVRTGNTITGYESANGSIWTEAGSITLPGLPSTLYVGLAGTSHNDGVLTTATFDQVSLGGATPPGGLPVPSHFTAVASSSSQLDLSWTDNSTDETGFLIHRSLDGRTYTQLVALAANVRTHADLGLAPNTTYYYRLFAQRGDTLSAPVDASATTRGAPPPDPAQSQDIGTSVAGSTGESGGRVTVTGSGADIWNRADGFRYRYQAWTGDGEITARVTGLTETHGWAKAGLMFRETLAANSRHASMIVSIAHGTALQYRAATGGESGSTTPSESGGIQQWLRLVRSGNTFTGYASLDGVTWTQAGSITLALPSTILVGLAVTSHNDGVLCTATFENFTVTGSGIPPPPPTSSWEFGDLGAVGLAGSNTASGNTITVNASGADIWDASDAFRFVYRVVSGDCTVEAQVWSLTNTHAWAKAGVMIRESTAANAQNVFAFITPSNGVVAQQRAITGGSTVATNGPWWVAAPYWVRLVRAGNRITAFSSADGTTWTQFAAYDVTMGVTAQVGFALTSHDNTQIGAAVFADPSIR